MERKKEEKLEYEYEQYNKHFPRKCLIMLFIFMIFIIPIVRANIIFGIGAGCVLLEVCFLIICVDAKFDNQYVDNNNRIKEKGIKVIGTIEKVHMIYRHPHRLYRSHIYEIWDEFGMKLIPVAYRILVKYNEKEYEIKALKFNNAFMILKEYLDKKSSYSKIDNTDINIDLYLHGSEFYADLNSVDIASIIEKNKLFLNKKQEK